MEWLQKVIGKWSCDSVQNTYTVDIILFIIFISKHNREREREGTTAPLLSNKKYHHVYSHHSDSIQVVIH